MSREGHVALGQLITGYVDLFLNSWFIMLLLGTLLGNENLWTPSYWEVFGSLFTAVMLISFSTRRAYDAIKVSVAVDKMRALTPETKKKPLI